MAKNPYDQNIFDMQPAAKTHGPVECLGMTFESDEQRREAALDIELARVGWGRDDATFRQVFTSQFLPDAPRDVWDEFDDLQRRTTSPENAVRFLEAFSQLDVSGIAPEVRCPTLILHARDDHRVPLESARDFAALIPDSRLAPLPSRNHILTRDEPAWAMFLAEVTAFLADDVASDAPTPR